MNIATPPVLACNLGAISAADRPRYHDLVRRVRHAVRSRSELPDGYAFHLDAGVITLAEITEWIGMEGLCCPFLMFQTGASADHSGWLLTVTGPAGVKAILES